MIETIRGNDILVNKGDEARSARPPSSQEISNSESGESAVQVDLRSDIAKDVNKSSERVSGNAKSESSMDEELQKSVDSLNEKLSKLDREILFKLDKKIGKNYISVVDKTSQEVIREFPPKEIRTFIARFDEFNNQLNSAADVKSLIVNLEV
jgi:flagellar protein FlaG